MDEIPALPKLRLCISAGRTAFRGRRASVMKSSNGRSIRSMGRRNAAAFVTDRDGTIFETVRRRARWKMSILFPLRGVDPEATAVRSGAQPASATVIFFLTDEEKLGGGVFLPDDLLARTAPVQDCRSRVRRNQCGRQKVNPAK